VDDHIPAEGQKPLSGIIQQISDGGCSFGNLNLQGDVSFGLLSILLLKPGIQELYLLGLLLQLNDLPV
jgi:hypothetical protein